MANESPCLKIASMSARLHQNEPSGWSLGHFGPLTHVVFHELRISTPSRFPGPSAKRIEMAHMQCDQLPPRGRNPSLSRVLVAANPTSEQIGTQ